MRAGKATSLNAENALFEGKEYVLVSILSEGGLFSLPDGAFKPLLGKSAYFE